MSYSIKGSTTKKKERESVCDGVFNRSTAKQGRLALFFKTTQKSAFFTSFPPLHVHTLFVVRHFSNSLQHHILLCLLFSAEASSSCPRAAVGVSCRSLFISGTNETAWTDTNGQAYILQHNVASIFACSPLATRGQAVHLDSDPKGENILYTNGKSVFIRNLEVTTYSPKSISCFFLFAGLLRCKGTYLPHCNCPICYKLETSHRQRVHSAFVQRHCCQVCSFGILHRLRR
jgi:hypothetical protein